MASRRMMGEVPSADVIITNPEHFSVALRYQRDVDKAPVVVAKGSTSRR
ncbi:EscU/YscU/HrcU family type III secretion system export apparatus switch protein [Plesiomonas shigelloides subsp. oncorhynchi]|nr:EscU/YscU/HrcU family type III secretion system export apparatus switch protein [Plesiomonas shigelloides]